jgi:hypothetical protein
MSKYEFDVKGVGVSTFQMDLAPDRAAVIKNFIDTVNESEAVTISMREKMPQKTTITHSQFRAIVKKFYGHILPLSNEDSEIELVESLRDFLRHIGITVEH